jgi:hypothetical protein
MVIVYILIGIAALIAIFCVVVAMQPAEFRITRSATMAAPTSTVFAQVNDFHNWVAWSPWEKLDPALKRNYQGQPMGTGAVYSWVGNKQVGEGRMTITESRPNEFIRLQLEFLKPFVATNTTEFTFQPQGNQTLMTWDMAGKNNCLFKAFGLLFNMQKIVGKQFEEGLSNLKAVVEGPKK